MVMLVVVVTPVVAVMGNVPVRTMVVVGEVVVVMEDVVVTPVVVVIDGVIVTPPVVVIDGVVVTPMVLVTVGVTVSAGKYDTRTSICSLSLHPTSNRILLTSVGVNSLVSRRSPTLSVGEGLLTGIQMPPTSQPAPIDVQQ